ncbi:hypothetical protein [Streptomyces phaeochromogenes]|uniref:hypothetical protein n=1 Tax=Streptomyces phaeochromogenes TaxID=1923 RepID=UPI002DDBE1A0|nr:hypothetical protein [Streptomyces phaeochromogenes]
MTAVIRMRRRATVLLVLMVLMVRMVRMVRMVLMVLVVGAVGVMVLVFPALQVRQPAVQSITGPLGIRDPHPGLGRRNALPQPRDPVALPTLVPALTLTPAIADDDQQIGLRRPARTRPPATRQLRFHREPLPRGSGVHHEENARPRHGRPHE